ncbi:MAG: ATP-binding protein [Steroidobacteraceae bacterium]
MSTDPARLPVAAATVVVAEPSPSLAAEVQFTEGLPLALVSVLERRYLSHFRAADWRVEASADDNARPLLREITALGRPQEPGIFARAMPHVLTACHDPGHSLLMVLHGSGGRHRLYVGGRRIIGAGARSTEDYLSLQESAFRSHVSGLAFGPLCRLDQQEVPELATFLRDAPAIRIVTGIPSRRAHDPSSSLQSLDRLVAAVGDQAYVLMVVAEPLDATLIDEAIDVCRRLKSEVHAYVRRTVQRVQGGSKSESRTETEETQRKNPLVDDLPVCLSSLAAFASFVALPLGLNAAPLVAALNTTMTAATLFGRRDSTGKSSQAQEGTNWSESGGVDLLDAHAEACEQMIQRYTDRLVLARSGGCWRTVVYLIANSDAAIHAVAGGLRSFGSGDSSALDPLRVLALPDHWVRGAIQSGQILQMQPSSGAQGHPLGRAFDTLATCLDGEELAVLVTPPQREIPGLPMREHSDFALSVPAPESDAVTVGSLQDALGRDLGPVAIPARSLNRHVFVTGTPGSGKTNSCMQILLEAYDRLRVPFLVLEPAKSEYRRLLQTPELKGKLGVYGFGGGVTLPLRLNPLAPVRGVPLGRHIDMLKAVFNASFSMFAGMQYVLEEALLEIYTERGWSLYTSGNAHLGERPSQDELSALTPNLQDLHDKIDVVLTRKKYGQEIHQNMGAALRSRLRSLLVGNKGLALNTRRSTPLESIFSRPAVIELQDLGDDDEKSFVMALLFVFLCQYAEARQRDLPESRRERLQHLTLVEEAHRLLEAPRGGTSAETGDPRGKAVSMFTNMLAEMRAYGEGFIIADQIPSKLAADILKNSYLKIAHQLLDAQDRHAVGGCMNLTEAQIRHLNTLPTGYAAVHDERIGSAVLVRMLPVKSSRAPALADREVRDLARLADAGERAHLRRHAGCRVCSSPCDFLTPLEEAPGWERIKRTPSSFFEEVLLGEADRAWMAWSGWRADLRALPGLRLDAGLGIEYCAAGLAAHEWLGTLLEARRAASPEGGLMPTDRLQREAAARALSPFLMTWLRASALGADEHAAFQQARQHLLATVVSAPPREDPNCRSCPMRCRMLSFVAPHVAGLARQLPPLVLQDSTERALLAIERSAAAAMRTSGVIAESPPGSMLRYAWFYCLLANAKMPAADTASARDKLLGKLSDLCRHSAEKDLEVFGSS